ncbi:amidoligase family protein [Crateriforma spongiae]|uniref:amidoligase family protein n=1 Tax=Crateriforma spongiae TaxID=2724528 RepID=UPI0039B0203E
MPASDPTPIGGYHNGLPVSWLPTGWKAERDSSIQTLAPNRKGCEFVSPVLRGYEGLQSVLTAVDAITARGGKVNYSTGIHVTVSFGNDAAALARLISLIGNHERAIYASTGTRRREQNRWAKRIKDYGNKDAAKRRCESDRYARRKAEAWWSERCLDPCPSNAEEAVDIAGSGLLAATEKLIVRSIAGQKYDRIIKQTLGEIPNAALEEAPF